MRYKVAKKVSIYGILGNTFLLIIKLIGGLISHSQAMIADALNSAGDIFSSIMTFIGNKIASKPRDTIHNLGYGKAEYFYSILIAIVMIYVSAKLLYQSIMSFFIKGNYHITYHLIIICLITIFIKIILYKYAYKKGKEINNLLIKANALDHRNDCFLTLGNLIAIIFALNNIFWVDSLVGIIISFWILVNGIKIYLEAYYVLLDRSIDEETIEEVIKIVKSHPEVIKVNHINSTPIGYQYQVNLTIFVDGNMSTYESHEIANHIEKELNKIDIISLAVIHVNPCEKEP